MTIIPFPARPVRVRIVYVLQAADGAQATAEMDGSADPWAAIADTVATGFAARHRLDDIERAARIAARNFGFDDATVDAEEGVYHVGVFTDVNATWAGRPVAD